MHALAMECTNWHLSSCQNGQVVDQRHISVAVTSAVYLILFVSFSKYYKLRKRSDIMPIQLFAEEYFEKELEGQRRLESERLQ